MTSRKKLNTRFILLLAVCTLLFCWNPAWAEEKDDPRGVVVEEVNPTPAFMVRVDVDHPDRIYRGGEEMRVTVRSEKAGHLYLFYCDANKNVSCLFPNKVQNENRIQASTPIIVPAEGAKFRLRIALPYGKEVLKTVVSLEPLKGLDLDTLTKGDITPLELSQVKDVFAKVQKEPAKSWAEHQVEITTLDPKKPDPEVVQRAKQHKRFGVFIGISDYESRDIKKLRICHEDARQLADVMKNRCKLDDAIVLLNQQATLKNIEEAIRKRLPAATRPGDEIILFWSGHGGRLPDKTEKDGYAEFLVPYDGKVDDLSATRRTMLMDKTFGRWAQELDGRRIVVILDACYSAGQHKFGKGLAPEGAEVSKDLVEKSDFLFGRLAGHFTRLKDLDQKELAFLASSKATEVSFERYEADLSVMTYFLVEQLKKGNEPITLKQAFENLKVTVPAYVQKAVRGETQTPVLVDQTTPPVYLRTK